MTKPLLRTKICDLFGIDYPILLAGMGDVCKDDAIANAKLTAAVSNAGGMGIIGGGTLSPEKLRQEIREVKRLTNKPFGVDLVFSPGAGMKGSIEEIQESLPEEHVKFVDGLYEKFEVPRLKGPEIKVLDPAHSMEQWQVCVDEGIKVVAMGLGTPDWLVPAAHKLGMKVISLVGNVKQAISTAAMGVDMIVAQGHEAGGHTGRIGLMALLPRIVAEIAPVPVLAAGGITNGDQLAASLALGAEGVWVGTAFQASKESPLPEPLKQAIVDSTEDDPKITRIATGKTVRALPSPLIKAWKKSGMETLPAPFQNYLVRDFLFSAWEHDAAELGLVGAGQGAGLINEIKSAEQIVNDFVEKAISTLTVKLPEDVQVG